MGGWFKLANFMPIHKHIYHPPFNHTPEIIGDPPYLSWKLPQYRPWLYETKNRTLYLLSVWINGLFNSGRGSLIQSIGFSSLREIKQINFVYSEILEKPFVRKMRQLSNNTLFHTRFAFHGTSIASAHNLLNHAADPRYLKLKNFGVTPIYVSEVIDKALKYAYKHRVSTETETAVVVFKVIGCSSETVTNHVPTSEPLRADLRRIMTESDQPSDITLPSNDKKPSWEVLVKNPDQLAPIAIIILHPLNKQ